METVESKLMSFVTADLICQSHLDKTLSTWDSIINDMEKEFVKSKVIRHTVTKIWNKDGIYRIGFLWEYPDHESYLKTQVLIKEVKKRFEKETNLPVKNYPNRGIVMSDKVFS